jgi:peptide-methionine (S)-S-oxide reductase
VRTRVGYTGGRSPNPTYRDIGDHTESVQIDYDPTQTSYPQLLRVFWATPNSCAASGSRQYMSAVFYHSEAQKKLALESRDRESAARGTPVSTDILPAGTFYVAEDYHQKYLLREETSLSREFEAMYPNAKDFMNSTAAARVNGYLAGHGSEAMIQSDIDRLGLSPEAKKTLLRLWKRAR